MKMVKSLLLGSAAGLIAVAGAQAADLPVKAKPVEYVKVCSIYGAGFYYIPGTDTCLKVGGYVRMDVGIYAGGSHGAYVNGANGRDTRETSWYQTRTRGIASWDARTQTEYGTLRAYFNAGWEQNSADSSYRGQGSAGAGTAVSGQFFFRGFIQFAGLTIGKTQSFFGFYNNALNYTTLVGGGQSDAGHNVLAYTASFGGGFSATISLEDNQQTRNGLWDASFSPAGAFIGTALATGAVPGGGAPAYGDYAANRWPNIVANLRLDQPWGSAQLSAAIHEVAGLYIGANNTGASAGDATGWAISGGVKFNLPWAQGDELWLQATWARGFANALGFNAFVHTAGQWITYDSARPVGGCTAGVSCGTMGAAWFLDGVFDANGISLTEGWSILGAVQHYWTPALRTSLFAHWTELRYPGATGAKFCNGMVASGLIAAVNCNPDFQIVQIGSRTIWSPVRNLDIGLEVLYTGLRQNFGNAASAINPAGAGAVLPTAGARPGGTYTWADQDVWSGTVRFQRNFWP